MTSPVKDLELQEALNLLKGIAILKTGNG
jgi:hypothetical protein